MEFDPIIRVLQDPAAAGAGAPDRLWPDTMQGTAESAWPGGPRPLTVF